MEGEQVYAECIESTFLQILLHAKQPSLAKSQCVGSPDDPTSPSNLPVIMLMRMDMSTRNRRGGQDYAIATLNIARIRVSAYPCPPFHPKA